MRLPKTAIVATGFILPSFVLGLIVAMQPATHAKRQQHIRLSGSTMSEKQTEPTIPTSTTVSRTTSTPSNPFTDPSKPTAIPATTTSVTPVAPAAQGPSATQTPTPSNSTPITATYAELSDWSAPILYTGTTPQEPAGTMVEYKYCTYYFSNGVTKQQLYQTQYGSAGAFDNDPKTGGWSITVDPEIGCTIANAPPVQ